MPGAAGNGTAGQGYSASLIWIPFSSSAVAFAQIGEGYVKDSASVPEAI
jgi:hypothetical protein